MRTVLADAICVAGAVGEAAPTGVIGGAAKAGVVGVVGTAGGIPGVTLVAAGAVAGVEVVMP